MEFIGIKKVKSSVRLGEYIPKTYDRQLKHTVFYPGVLEKGERPVWFGEFIIVQSGEYILVQDLREQNRLDLSPNLRTSILELVNQGEIDLIGYKEGFGVIYEGYCTVINSGANCYFEIVRKSMVDEFLKDIIN